MLIMKNAYGSWMYSNEPVRARLREVQQRLAARGTSVCIVLSKWDPQE